MVRFYTRERFTKNSMSLDVAKKALEIFGGPPTFSKSKIIHSTACYMNKHEQLFTINISDEAPRCKNDFWMLHFLRAYSDCIVTTG